MEVSRQAHGSALQASASRRSAQRVEVGEAGLEVRVKVHVEPVLCRPPPTQPLRQDMFMLALPTMCQATQEAGIQTQYA